MNAWFYQQTLIRLFGRCKEIQVLTPLSRQILIASLSGTETQGLLPNLERIMQPNQQTVAFLSKPVWESNLRLLPNLVRIMPSNQQA